MFLRQTKFFPVLVVLLFFTLLVSTTVGHYVENNFLGPTCQSNIVEYSSIPDYDQFVKECDHEVKHCRPLCIMSKLGMMNTEGYFLPGHSKSVLQSILPPVQNRFRATELTGAYESCSLSFNFNDDLGVTEGCASYAPLFDCFRKSTIMVICEGIKAPEITSEMGNAADPWPAIFMKPGDTETSHKSNTPAPFVPVAAAASPNQNPPENKNPQNPSQNQTPQTQNQQQNQEKVPPPPPSTPQSPTSGVGNYGQIGPPQNQNQQPNQQQKLVPTPPVQQQMMGGSPPNPAMGNYAQIGPTQNQQIGQTPKNYGQPALPTSSANAATGQYRQPQFNNNNYVPQTFYGQQTKQPPTQYGQLSNPPQQYYGQIQTNPGQPPPPPQPQQQQFRPPNNYNNDPRLQPYNANNVYNPNPPSQQFNNFNSSPYRGGGGRIAEQPQQQFQYPPQQRPPGYQGSGTYSPQQLPPSTGGQAGYYNPGGYGAIKPVPPPPQQSYAAPPQQPQRPQQVQQPQQSGPINYIPNYSAAAPTAGTQTGLYNQQMTRN
ncbi:hypothetical protein Fcan01_26233 [Folsomia candida]|uniref:Uncharacterized protein n=1 Tax=Folsomia candida TaxID=158441 RepID=A0A226D157_FOLCA|nr:hypothetical protein Fcan01_26233 [Folsomia candida]